MGRDKIVETGGNFDARKSSVGFEINVYPCFAFAAERDRRMNVVLSAANPLQDRRKFGG